MTRGIVRRERRDWPFSDPFFSRILDIPVVSFGQGPASIEEGTLAVDVSEDDKFVYVRASLPGFERKDVDVEIHDGVVSIKAEHAEEHEEAKEHFYRRERTFGSVSRRVALPSAVLEDEARADLKDGVLELRVPKVKEASPRKVSIG